MTTIERLIDYKQVDPFLLNFVKKFLTQEYSIIPLTIRSDCGNDLFVSWYYKETYIFIDFYPTIETNEYGFGTYTISGEYKIHYYILHEDCCCEYDVDHFYISLNKDNQEEVMNRMVNVVTKFHQ